MAPRKVERNESEIRKKLLRDVTVDEFMSKGFSSTSESEISSDEANSSDGDIDVGDGKPLQPRHQALGQSIKQKMKNVKFEENQPENSDTSDSDAENVAGHKASLRRLKEKDPEFYNYLQENDKELLNFSDSDDDDQHEDNEKSPKKIGNEEDEDETSEDDMSRPRSPLTTLPSVTPKLIRKWKEQLQAEKPQLTAISEVVSAFKSAVQQAAGDDSSQPKFSVEGSAAFNSIMNLCLTELLPGFYKFLKLSPPQDAIGEDRIADPSKSRAWKKLMMHAKSYISDMLKVLSAVAEPSIVRVLLKHILQLIPFFLPFVKFSRLLIKNMITFWCTGEESIRVLAFLCIIRTTKFLPPEYLDYTLKQMCIAYVKNCKFTSPSTWPLITFMKRCLVEMYALDQNIAYQQSFIYIRQLAIHLRNAITLKKKDSFQAVYNWQYVHCLLLWVHLLSSVHPSETLKPLIYPLTQTIVGAIKLIPTARYFPLRFHLVRALIQLSRDTNTFIPVLPFITEVFQIVDFEKKHASVSMKPLNFSCALKLSKSQLQENGFKDGVIDQVYDLTMEYLHNEAHKISFPELVFPATLQIKDFLKKCKITNHCRRMKQLLDKIDENSKAITEKRRKVSFGICDIKAIEQWERECLLQGTPIGSYYTTWKTLKELSVPRATSKPAKEAQLKRGPMKKRLKHSEMLETCSTDEDQTSDEESDSKRPNPSHRKEGMLKLDESHQNKSLTESPSKRIKIEMETEAADTDIVEDFELSSSGDSDAYTESEMGSTDMED